MLKAGRTAAAEKESRKSSPIPREQKKERWKELDTNFPARLPERGEEKSPDPLRAVLRKGKEGEKRKSAIIAPSSSS